MEKMTRESAVRRSVAGLSRWFLLTGNRLQVSLIMLLGVGITFFAAGVLELATVTSSSRLMWYLNGTVNGLLTLIPISVGVNQIVLSHEFGSIQNLYERRTNITEFRERVEEQTGMTVSSPRASAFFATLLTSVEDEARILQQLSDPLADEQPIADVASVADSIVEEVNQANDDLTETGPTMLRTLLIVLDYKNTRHYYEIRRLQSHFSDGEIADSLQQINELFVEIDAARQFLKTEVVERQLAHLSRLLIATGVPAVTVAALAIFAYRDIAGLTVPHSLLVAIAGTIIVVTLVPLAILSAYILRVATIARKTATFGPFISEADE